MNILEVDPNGGSGMIADKIGSSLEIVLLTPSVDKIAIIIILLVSIPAEATTEGT